MALTFDRFIELVTTLPAESKAMLRTLQRGNPMRLTELHTRAMFDVHWKEKERGTIIEDLIERGLVEKYMSKFGVELVRLTLDGEDFLDSIDSYVTETPNMSEVLK